MSKRSQQRRVTPQAKALRYLRHKAGLSVNLELYDGDEA